MVEVTVKLKSAIHKSRDRVLGTARITNDGSKIRRTNGRKGDYNVELLNSKGVVYRRGYVEDYPRISKNMWALIYRALNSALKDKDK